MADFTKTTGQLMDWTTLDDTGAVPTLETGELDSGESLDVAIETMLHIDVCSIDINAKANAVEVIVLIKTGTTDDDWSEHIRVSASTTTATDENIAADSGLGEANPDRVEVAATAGFITPGQRFFIKDASTLADSTIAWIKDYVSNDYIQVTKNLLHKYLLATPDVIYDIVDQWDIVLPPSIAAAKVLFANDDADANYACRVRYTMDTAIA